MSDSCCVLAELQRLGNTAFVNTHEGPAPGPLEHAISEGYAAGVEMMMSCGASPRQQGSDWASFLRAATASFTPAKAALVHRLIKQKSAFEVEVLPGKGCQRQCLLCMHLGRRAYWGYKDASVSLRDCWVGTCRVFSAICGGFHEYPRVASCDKRLLIAS